MTAQPPGWLGPAGPAQFEFLIHFCGRPSFAAMTPTMPQTIRDLKPWQRLHNILREGQIRGFAPFGSESPMVCLSESPLEHLSWLLSHRQWPPWGLLLRRQTVCTTSAGGPSGTPAPSNWRRCRRSCAAGPYGSRPGPTDRTGCTSASGVSRCHPTTPCCSCRPTPFPVILVGDPRWQPTALIQRTVFVDHYGMPAALGQPDHPQNVDVPELPHLWTTAVERWYRDPAGRRAPRTRGDEPPRTGRTSPMTESGPRAAQKGPQRGAAGCWRPVAATDEPSRSVSRVVVVEIIKIIGTAMIEIVMVIVRTGVHGVGVAH